MSSLLNVGNVKAILKNTFRRNYDHFILLCAGENILYLAEIRRMNSAYKIGAFSVETRKNDDELFYQEVLYHFCRDRNLKNLPVFMTLEDTVVMKKQFDFPKMPPSDMKKAVDWELNDWKKDFVYGYTTEDSDTDCCITAVLCEKKYLHNWQEIIDEQNLSFATVFYAEEKDFEDDLMFTADDAELMANINESDWRKIKNTLLSISHHTQINLNGNFCRTTYLNWRNIVLSIGLCLTVFSSFITGFYMYDYMQTKEQQAVSAQQLQLRQADSDLIDELKRQEDIIKYKQDTLKKIYTGDSLCYPLLVNLGTTAADGVKLTFVTIKDRHVQLKGKATDYSSLSSYKAGIERIKFVNNVKIGDTKLNETDNLIDFTLYFNNEVK